MTPYLRDLLDQLPSDRMREAFRGVDEDSALEILECYHFTANAEGRAIFEEFLDEGGPAVINEMLTHYRDGTPTTRDLQEIYDLPNPE